MRLSRFALRRFGAFDKETAFPVSEVTVLVGPNNLGKSTVLRALQVFFEVLSRHIGPRTYRLYSGRSRSAYVADRDYPKRYEGRPGRRWSTRLIGTFLLDESDRQACESDIGIEVPPNASITVEYPTDRQPMPSVIVGCEDVPTGRARDFIGWLLLNIRYVYIPAARGGTPYRAPLFAELISSAIRGTTQSKRRLESLHKFHSDASAQLAGLERTLADHLRNYLPDVRTVEFSLEEPNLLDFLSVREVLVDDGAKTALDQKGDGFRSLFELALLQFVAQQRHSSNLIFGIEEPESHLHPSSIYDVKSTLRGLSENSQILITTHSPILIQRDSVRSNIIIDRVAGEEFSCTARQARSLTQIRESLGIRPQDNLATAAVVVVTEGLTEEHSLPALLGATDESLVAPFLDGKARVLGCGGASNVPGVVRALARDASTCVVLLDSDHEGETAREKVIKDGLVAASDLFRVPPRAGCAETEFEDMFDPDLYFGRAAEACGITATAGDFRTARTRSGSRNTRMMKWSDVMEQLLQVHGRDWEQCMNSAKEALAGAVADEAVEAARAAAPLLASMSARIGSYLAE